MAKEMDMLNEVTTETVNPIDLQQEPVSTETTVPADTEETPEVTSKETPENASETDENPEKTSEEKPEEIPEAPPIVQDDFREINESEISTKDKSVLYLMRHYNISPDLINALLEGNFDKSWAAITELNKENLSVKAKLTKELGGATDDRVKIVRFLIDKAKDAIIAQQIMADHKSFSRCYDYITKRVRKLVIGSAGCVQVDDDKVYQMALDYYALDDYKEVMEERKKEEERKKKLEEAKAKAAKKTTEKKTTTRGKKKAAETEEKKEETQTNVASESTTTDAANPSETASSDNTTSETTSEPTTTSEQEAAAASEAKADEPAETSEATIATVTEQTTTETPFFDTGVQPDLPWATPATDNTIQPETENKPVPVVPEAPQAPAEPEIGDFAVCDNIPPETPAESKEESPCTISSEDGQMVFCFG